MNRRDYIDFITNIDETSFIKEVSVLAYKLDLGMPIPEWKISVLRDESDRRLLDFDKLLAGSSPVPQNLSFLNDSYKSFDQLDESKIEELKYQIRKRQRTRVDTDRLNTSTLPVFFSIAPESMIIAAISGDSMTGFGLKEGDMVVIDSSLTPKSGEIILVRVEQEVFIKKLEIEKGFITLHSGNDKYKKVRITSGRDYEILGVMRYHIKSADN